MKSLFCAWIPLLSYALLAGCDRKPDLPPERAADVQAARDEVKKAQRDFAKATTPDEVVGTGTELTSAVAQFQKKRDAAVQSVLDTLEEADQDIRHLVATRSQVEFRDTELGRKADAVIAELAAARTDLERELVAMGQATVDTWTPVEERVALLTARIRDARQRARDQLF